MELMGTRMDHWLQWTAGVHFAIHKSPDFDDTAELFWDALTWLQSGVDDG